MPTSEEPSRLLREVAYERLRDAITGGKLLPATSLSEVQLAKEMAISRTPVREALQQLTQEGLVRVIPGRAVIVAAPSMKEVMEVVHVRYVLEPELARLAARHATADIKKMLAQTIKKMEGAAAEGNRKEWSRLDTLFHEALSEACPNNLLSKQTMQMRNRVHFMVNDAQIDVKRIIECTAEHKAVAEAIIAGDAALAESAMRDHIAQLRSSLITRLAHL